MKHWQHVALFSLMAWASVSKATAADWYAYRTVGNDNFWFFDANTVEKNKDIVHIWNKIVQMREPNSSGDWAMALRDEYNCHKRTTRVLTTASYDKDGNFLRSNNNSASVPSEIIPGSVAEGILETICKKDFPAGHDTKDYFKVRNNDPVKLIRDFVESQDSQHDPAPK